jgi:ATP-dependent RNA helicase SUPV3L1/SUV3
VARGIAFQVGESLGVLERSRIADEMKTLPQEARASLRKFGVRFGAYHLYLPALLKPAPRALAAQLWALQHGGLETVKGISEVAHLASSGRTSFAADPQINRGLYRAAGFRVCGERSVRVDILERLADLIRPAIAYRPGVTPGEPPVGAADGDGFVVTVAMTSLAGCSGEAFAGILKSLGYASEQRPGPAITVPLLPKASTEPIKAATPPTEEPAPEAQEGEGEAQIEVEASTEAETTPAEAPATEEPATQASDDAPASTPAPAEEAPNATEAPDEPAPVEADLVAETAPETEAAAPGETQDIAAEQAVDEAPAEPVLIEVWKPHRQHHGRRLGNDQRRPGGEQRRNGPRRGQGGGLRQEAATPAETPAQAAEGEVQLRPQRDDQSEGGKPRSEGKRRFEGKFDGKRREESKPGDRPQQADKRPPPREKKADPDSPFAKLAALKAELEAKGKK